MSDATVSAPVPASVGPVRLLAVGTSSEWCSVAWLDERTGRCETLSEFGTRAQSGRALPMIEDLLSMAGASLAQVDAIVFDAGPGAFTGLRVACGVAQGLGLALERRLIPIDSVRATAETAGASAVSTVNGSGAIAVALDARMGELYCGWVEPGSLARPPEIRVMPAEQACEWFDQRRARSLGAPAAGSPADGSPATLVAAGNGFSRIPLLARWARRYAVRCDGDAWPRADALALLGASAWRAGLSVDAAEAHPLYVRDKVALDVDEQARLRAGSRSGTSAAR